jgi:hypothetical protein
MLTVSKTTGLNESAVGRDRARGTPNISLDKERPESVGNDIIFKHCKKSHLIKKRVN